MLGSSERLLTSEAPNILGQDKSFSITWNSSAITAYHGKGEILSVFQNGSSPLLPIRAIAYSTYGGATGYWTVKRDIGTSW